MKLSFYAKPGHMVNRPGGRSVGAPPRYVGRRYVAVEDKAGGVAGSYPATDEPESFELSPTDPAYADLVRYTQKGGMWPADEATAAACSVEFVGVKQDPQSREWLPSEELGPTDNKRAISLTPNLTE